MRIVAATAAVLAALVGLGHVSGNQPERDSVAAAAEELGIALESRQIDVGDVSLHVVLAGPADGEPVLLLHGFPEFWYAWRGPMAELARRGFRVIVPDQRGYNESDKPAGLDPYRLQHLVADVIGLIDALGYERVHLGAEDWGGTIAWRTVLEHPERIRRYAVIDASHPLAGEGFETEEETVSWYRTFLQLPWIPGLAARVGDWWLLTSNLRGTSLPGAFPEPALDQFRSAWARDGAIHTMAAWYRAEWWPYEGNPRVSTPTLIVLAPEDAFIPSDVTRRSLRFLDRGRIHELESGSHWVAQEQPVEIGRIFAEFFAAERID